MQVATCPDLTQLKKLVSGHLLPADVETLVQHLETCPDCMAKVPGLSTPQDPLVELLAKAKTPPPGWQEPVIARLIDRLMQMKRGPEAGPKMLIFGCPACGKNMKAGADLAGKKVKCPGCAKVVSVPAPTQEASGSLDTRHSGADEKTLPPSPVANRSSVSQSVAASTPAAQGGTKETFVFLAPPQQPDELGRLGNYRVLKKLGSGGMGVVFLAEDTLLHRKVALKTMLPAFAADSQNRERFLREARAAASIEHDHIVAIHQVGEDNGVPYLAMPLLKGDPLDARLEREGKLPLAECLRIAAEMAEGLAAAHAAGLIHRDVKPGNVWLETRDDGRGERGEKDESSSLAPIAPRVKLLDFGLARSQRDDARLTQSGAVLGTPAYMPPEQAQGQTVDARADLFSLGCVLYEMLTGERPFRGENTISLLAALALQDPTPPKVKNPAVPSAVSDLTMKLLAKKPAGRPASAAEAARQLRVHLLLTNKEQGPSGEPPAPGLKTVSATRKNPLKLKWIGISGALAALLVLGIVFFWPTPHGVIRVEINDPAIEAAFLQDGMTFKGKDGQVIKVTPSKDVGLHIMRGDLEFDTDKFVLKNGETITLKIEWIKEGKLQVVRDGQIIGSKGSKASAVAGSKDSTSTTVGEQPVDLLKLIDPRTVSIVQKYELFENSHKPPRPTGVWAVALSRDGKRVLTVTIPRYDKGTPILWDAGSGKKIQTFPEIGVVSGHPPVVALSGDGKRVLTKSDDGKTAILWESDSGKQIRTFQTFDEHKNGVTCVALSGDGKLVVTGSFEHVTPSFEKGGNPTKMGANAAILWDALSGKKLQTFHGHSGPVYAVGMSADGERILTSGGDTTILWEAPTAKKIQTFQTSIFSNDEMALSDDGNLVLTKSHAYNDPSAILWDATSGKKIRTFKADKNDPMYRVALSGDGKLVLTGLHGSDILWDAATAKKIHTFQGRSMYVGSTGVALSEDGRRVLIGTTISSPDGRSVLIGTTTLWEIKGSLEPRNNSIVQKYHVHTANVQSVALSGRHVLTGSADKTAILWDAITGKNLHCFQGHAGIVWSVALSADAKYALTGSEDKTAILWDAVSNKKLQTFEGHSDQVMSVVLSGDRQHVLTGSLDKTAILWEAASGKKLQTLRGHAGQIQSVALCGSGGDDKNILTGSDDKTAILWEAASGKKLQTFEGHTGGVTSVAVSGDGKHVLTGSADNTAILWEAASGKKLQTFKAHQVKPGVGPMIGHTGAVNCVALSDDARLVLTGSDDKTAILWEAASGKILQTFEGHTGEVYGVAMRGDAKIVVTGSKDQTAILWEVNASPARGISSLP